MDLTEKQLALAKALFDLIVASSQSAITPDDLITASQLTRELKQDSDRVKKVLRALKEAHLIRAIGMNPKRFELDKYGYQQWLNQLEPDNPCYDLFGELTVSS